MNLRSKIKNILRENLLLEDEPSQEKVDELLDKINQRGKDSLTPLEKEYLDQASKGDVDPEIEHRIEKAKAMGEHIIDLIDSDNTEELKRMDHAHLMNAPQASVDAYIEYMADHMSLGANMLKLGSQEAIDKYARKKIVKGKPVPSELMSYVSESVVDNFIDQIMKGELSGSLIRFDTLQHASQAKVDEYTKFAGEKGMLLGKKALEMASQEAVDSYVKNMADHKFPFYGSQHKYASDRVQDYYEEQLGMTS